MRDTQRLTLLRDSVKYIVQSRFQLCRSWMPSLRRFMQDRRKGKYRPYLLIMSERLGLLQYHVLAVFSKPITISSGCSMTCHSNFFCFHGYIFTASRMQTLLTICYCYHVSWLAWQPQLQLLYRFHIAANCLSDIIPPPDAPVLANIEHHNPRAAPHRPAKLQHYNLLQQWTWPLWFTKKKKKCHCIWHLQPGNMLAGWSASRLIH